ncbi:DUF3558 domain-containing protein [Allokutzneria sp. A3M-2-11 16]|uniref:DUF3558 domain-containing protein n=1 Tax=Allokutzneria sp. A3M-2-11 16 TaxID=2962043 RepID=UPI0020B84EC1|nr:DUF3558 family protein [Allokutzneria sp. A3M-2-11 16]MCP3797764.1 DUF3558 domain-containing protein [Allokutzneria sp. A3M-2-11 16]
MGFLTFSSKAVTAAATASLLFGCTATHVGTANPQAVNGTTPNSVDRPRQLKIDRFKACELLSESQRVELKITRPPRQRDDPILKSDSCNFSNLTEGTILTTFVITKHDLEQFSPKRATGTVHPVRILDFPGFQINPEPQDPLSAHCSVNVGVSVGQVLRVAYATLGEQHFLPTNEVCRRATRGAELTLGNILAQS